MAFGFGDIISIGFRIISNKDEILKAWGQIAPMIKQATDAYANIRELVDKVAPGVIDEMQQQAPETTDPLVKGGDDEAFSAQWLQKSLNTLLGTNLEVDGDIGEETRKAIRQFQTQEGLPVDGWAGAGTCARILKKLEEKAAA